VARQSCFGALRRRIGRPHVSLYKFIAGHSRKRGGRRLRCQNIRCETQLKSIKMNPANLPFDSEAMLQGLRGWVECESPTWDAPAVERMLDIAARDMAIMGATIERIAGRQGFGGCVRARFPHPKQGEPGILIAGHLDTVHPIGTLQKLQWRRDGNKCFGPGIFDMKGGNYLTLEAIRQLARASFTTPLPITVLFTPDEEVGTPSTRDIIEAEAARNKYVLVPEPGRPDNGVVTGRYAIARFNLEAIGKPSHAGATLSSGRSENGTPDSRHRCHDDGGLYLQRWHRAWRPMGQLRRHHLLGRSAEHGQASGRSRSWRRAHAGAVRHRQRCYFQSHAWRDAAGMGARRRHHGAI
jgi:hypothetical protein